MKIIDSHVHFWNPELLDYDWLDGQDKLNRVFLPSDYLAETQATRVGLTKKELDVRGMVFVQADCATHQSLAEVKWVEGLDERIQAIVAFAPVELGDTSRSYLEELADHTSVKGIRRLIQSEKSGFSKQANFIKGVQVLSDYDLSFDICVQHHQLGDILALVRQCPDVRFVLNHAGKPDTTSALLSPWRENIQQLAEYENVTCKLSGLLTLNHVDTWSLDDLNPYVDHLLNTFGVQRLMFGSDYPVLTLAGTYKLWFSVVEEMLSILSEHEKSAIYFENARIFYKITAV